MDYTIFLTTEHLIVLDFKQYEILISGKNWECSTLLLPIPPLFEQAGGLKR